MLFGWRRLTVPRITRWFGASAWSAAVAGGVSGCRVVHGCT